MELLKLFNSYFNFFRFFGICIQTPGFSKQTKTFSYFSSIFWLFCSFIFLILLFFNHRETMRSETVHLIQALGLHLTHLTVILETLTTTNKQLYFWQNLKNIERFYDEEMTEVKLKYIQCKRIVVWKIWILLATSFLIETILVINLLLYYEWIGPIMSDVFTWSLNIVSVMVGRFRHMSHLLVIEILKTHLEIFNNSLVKLKIKSFLGDKSLIEKLNLIKFRHTHIWELCKSINSCYLWSQMMNFLINFIRFTSICYYLYYLIVSGNFFLFFVSN
uniref:Gustatory receptor n=1 Tax=Lutzomyia longipalpis TaxID=7200 RepID=A0A7G3B6J2_LUTLO